MDSIRSQIFMGSGDHSLAQMGRLYTELGRAFVVLGGIQQPPTCHEPKEAFDQHEQDIEDGEIELEGIAREISMGLTGKRVRFLPVTTFETNVTFTNNQPIKEKGRFIYSGQIEGQDVLVSVSEDVHEQLQKKNMACPCSMTLREPDFKLR